MGKFKTLAVEFYWRKTYKRRFNCVKTRRQFAIRLFSLGLWIGLIARDVVVGEK